MTRAGSSSCRIACYKASPRRCARLAAAAHVRQLRLVQVPEIVLNGDKDSRYPGNVNISFAYVEVPQRQCCTGSATRM